MTEINNEATSSVTGNRRGFNQTWGNSAEGFNTQKNRQHNRGHAGNDLKKGETTEKKGWRKRKRAGSRTVRETAGEIINGKNTKNRDQVQMDTREGTSPCKVQVKGRARDPIRNTVDLGPEIAHGKKSPATEELKGGGIMHPGNLKGTVVTQRQRNDKGGGNMGKGPARSSAEAHAHEFDGVMGSQGRRRGKEKREKRT